MRKWICGVIMLAIAAAVFAPTTSFTEDQDTIRLARTLYALGRRENYETKLALGSVVMNRVESDWFPDTLGKVLADQQQFPAGTRYDEESLRAAHALLSGTRTLPENALYYQADDASCALSAQEPLASAGNYNFYAQAQFLRLPA